MVSLIVAFIIGYYLPVIYLLAKLLALGFFFFLLLDIFLLFGTTGQLVVSRDCNDRFSNGDENEVWLTIRNRYRFSVFIELIDELPVQFQERNFKFQLKLNPTESRKLKYSLRPMTRGAYAFGNLIGYASTSIRLVQRQFKSGERKDVKVYPSFIRIHQYELMAISQNLTMPGQKQVRRVGNSKEFDTIKDYVPGDDPRNINWAATARRGHVMTNHYIDERSQNIYCVIDKSRAMKMPFEGMTLLDYAINASLILSDVSLKKGDKAGLLTFEDKVDTSVKAGNSSTQLYKVMEALYHQETSFKEPDFSAVFNFLSKNVNQRSLLLLFTNFESIHSLKRQLNYIKLLNRKHLVLVIYFRNTEVDRLITDKVSGTRELYNQVIAYQMLEEKLLIRDELNKAGILSLYATPKSLNVDVINKYIEVKARRIL